MISIRRRLLVFLLPALLVALAIAAAASYTEAKREIGDVLDYHLREVAEALRDHSVMSIAKDQIDQHDPPQPGILLQIWNRRSGAAVNSHGAPLPMSLQTGFQNVSVDGRALRLYSLVTASRVIQVAQPVGVGRDIGAEVAVNSVWPVAAALPLVVLIVWVAVGKGLAPLQRMAAEVAERTALSLEPLPSANLPAEVAPLLEGLNSLLERLAIALKVQREFIADAAHELRSPMTALRLHLELLEDAEDAQARVQAIIHVKAALERGIHMIEQLLALACLDPEAPVVREEVDLLTIAKAAVVSETVFADEKNIDLGLVSSTPAVVSGDRGALATMLHNLIDNAVRYTPAGGLVDVAVHSEAEAVLLEVIDNGPGIAPALRDRVFHRFDRGERASGSGSGLGLAIVKRVVERLGGSIALCSGENGAGLRVRVRLPRARA